MQTEHKTIVGVILLVIVFVISIPFEKRYDAALSRMANDPAARLLAGMVVLYLAHHDVVLGALGFVILFLWMSDIQLLSSLKF
jgi:hypothetical protein